MTLPLQYLNRVHADQPQLDVDSPAQWVRVRGLPTIQMLDTIGQQREFSWHWAKYTLSRLVDHEIRPGTLWWCAADSSDDLLTRIQPHPRKPSPGLVIPYVCLDPTKGRFLWILRATWRKWRERIR